MSRVARHDWITAAFGPKRPRTAARTPSQRVSPNRRRLRVEALEHRRMLATFTVNTLIDTNAADGLTTLREAITSANANPDTDTINFAASLTASGPAVIQLTNSGHVGEIAINNNVTITGPGAQLLTVKAYDPTTTVGDGSRIFNIDDGSAATDKVVNISGLTLTGGDLSRTAGVGGAIFSKETLTITNSTISGSGAKVGGGVYGAGSTTINSSTIRGNISAYGGGIFQFQKSLIVNNSTISANQTPSSNGGGIEVSGANMTITNSTISGNISGAGGGIASYNTTANVNNSTVAFNYGNVAGGGIYVAGSGSMTLNHTIIALNTKPGGRDDIHGSATLSYSLLGDNTGASITNGIGNQIGTAAAPIDPLLAPLADNGGPTWTHALLPGSPAIDAGNPSFGASLTSDQRARTICAHC